ncbi:hypothetical protein C5S53_00860 [Methanophagales archaeon]|nr:hypothetical protein C5S53_00860 [Methanophagales archaeon]
MVERVEKVERCRVTSEMVDLRTVDGWMCVCLTNSCRQN